MIRRVEALNYRCLQYIDQRLEDFHLLVGPNASGKTTFLDVIAFLGDLVSGGLEKAIDDRTADPRDLVWARSGDRFELALEVDIPEERRRQLGRDDYAAVRYEVAVGLDRERNESSIVAEKVLLKPAEPLDVPKELQLEMFPRQHTPPRTLTTPSHVKTAKTVINKVHDGNDNFYSEVYHVKGKGWVPSFKLGPKKSALGNIPADESKFPVSTWLRGLLAEGVQRFVLNSLLMRRAGPSGKGRRFKPDGSNLPWVIENLKNESEALYRDWVARLGSALPEIEGIRTVEREDDRHRYLVVRCSGGMEIPSWMTSDGTLRFLALTVPAYLPDPPGVYLIEEPENGLHPRAVEALFQSFSSVSRAQVLVATHSPRDARCGGTGAGPLLCQDRGRICRYRPRHGSSRARRSRR